MFDLGDTLHVIIRDSISNFDLEVIYYLVHDVGPGRYNTCQKGRLVQGLILHELVLYILYRLR